MTELDRVYQAIINLYRKINDPNIGQYHRTKILQPGLIANAKGFKELYNQKYNTNLEFIDCFKAYTKERKLKDEIHKYPR